MALITTVTVLNHLNQEVNVLRKARFFILGIILVFNHGVLAAATSEFALDNGLRIIVREDHRAPVVVSQIWYKVGSSYEHAGITGVSHALEHMMFKGTRAAPAARMRWVAGTLPRYSRVATCPPG